MKEKNLKTENPVLKMDELRKKLLEDHDKKIAVIKTKVEDAENKAANAEKHMKAAKDSLNYEDYDQYRVDKQHAEMELEVYASKFENVSSEELISKAESDAVIDEVLEYKKGIDDDLLKAIASHIAAVNGLLSEYHLEIDNMSSSLRSWTHEVHKYRDASVYGFHDGEFIYACKGFIPFSIIDIEDTLRELLRKDDDLKQAMTKEGSN